jgi:thiol:disulfide interchange protein DsbD
MYPLIPIISNFIMGQNEASSSRGVWLSFLYVQAMAVTYAIAGILAGLSGLLLAVWMQQAWVLILLAVFFMMMALAMMGVFELQLSTRLQSWLISQTQRLPGGKASSAVVLGAVSALIVGPCVAPPLAAILVSISQEAAIWSGGLRLYIMALGIGTPLLLIALLGRHILPRLSPQIMRGVRQLFGLVLFGSALWVLSPLLSNTTVILLFTVLLLIASGLFAVVARGGNGISQWAFRLIALSCFLLGGAQLAGVWSGNQNIWRPLAAWFPTKTPRLSWSPVDSIAQVHAHLGQGKPVILDFYADWCISCKEMEYFTFTDVAVAKQIQDMILLKADMTKNTVEHRALLRAFGLYGPPAILFFDRRGQLIKTRVVGFQSASRFVQTLQQIRAVQ